MNRCGQPQLRTERGDPAFGVAAHHVPLHDQSRVDGVERVAHVPLRIHPRAGDGVPSRDHRRLGDVDAHRAGVGDTVVHQQHRVSAVGAGHRDRCIRAAAGDGHASHRTVGADDRHRRHRIIGELAPGDRELRAAIPSTPYSARRTCAFSIRSLDPPAYSAAPPNPSYTPPITCRPPRRSPAARRAPTTAPPRCRGCRAHGAGRPPAARRVEGDVVRLEAPPSMSIPRPSLPPLTSEIELERSSIWARWPTSPPCVQPRSSTLCSL